MALVTDNEKIIASPEFGVSLVLRMKNTFDFEPIVWTMLRYNQDMERSDALSRLDAFIQWFSLIPTVESGCWYVMLETPVEDAFHSFVLNTRVYADFCDQFLGHFFHHDPAPEEAPDQFVRESAEYTVAMLQSNFKENLNPLLQDWVRQVKDGTFKVACVNCD